MTVDLKRASYNARQSLGVNVALVTPPLNNWHVPFGSSGLCWKSNIQSFNENRLASRGKTSAWTFLIYFGSRIDPGARSHHWCCRTYSHSPLFINTTATYRYYSRDQSNICCKCQMQLFKILPFDLDILLQDCFSPPSKCWTSVDYPMNICYI